MIAFFLAFLFLFSPLYTSSGRHGSNCSISSYASFASNGGRSSPRLLADSFHPFWLLLRSLSFFLNSAGLGFSPENWETPFFLLCRGSLLSYPFLAWPTPVDFLFIFAPGSSFCRSLCAFFLELKLRARFFCQGFFFFPQCNFH